MNDVPVYLPIAGDFISPAGSSNYLSDIFFKPDVFTSTYKNKKIVFSRLDYTIKTLVFISLTVYSVSARKLFIRKTYKPDKDNYPLGETSLNTHQQALLYKLLMNRGAKPVFVTTTIKL